MTLEPLYKIFDIRYGNQFDLNKMELSDDPANEVNFVSRSSQNLGVVAKVSRMDEVEPFEPGLITVTLGGSYLLSSFIQPNFFYTGQNVKVLKPLRQMGFNEKLFYCKAIEANRYKYTSHGREANATLNTLLVPSSMPKEFSVVNGDDILLKDYSAKMIEDDLELDINGWKPFKYGGKNGIFDIRNGYYNKKPEHTEEGLIPFIGATEFNNGVTDYYSLFDIENSNKDEKSVEHDLEFKIFPGNCITVNNNGTNIGNAFYQDKDFTCSHDVNVLYLKDVELNKNIALFLCSVIQLEKYRWAYGRKWRPSRMPESEIRLPVVDSGQPNWIFMERYIKSLPYSSSI